MELIILFNTEESKILLQIAKKSINNGLTQQAPLEIRLDDYSEHLQMQLATFVTLHESGKLRGCIGSLEAKLPLVADVSKNAFLAAFRDPRFSPIHTNEIPEISLEISILSTPQEIKFKNEEDLLQKLRPGIDGLILSDSGRKGTFLPTVWEQLPNPRDFLNHLKNKAGLPISHWSDTIKIERYITQLIS